MLLKEKVQQGLEYVGMTIEKDEIRKRGRLHLVARKPFLPDKRIIRIM